MAMWLLAPLAAAQTFTNPSFSAPAPTAIPNTGTINGWPFLAAGGDVGQANVDIDCASVLTNNSKNGGQFLRATSDGTDNQGVSQSISGLTVGTAYKVRFEQSLVRHFGQATGHWTVEFALVPNDGPDLSLPAGNPAQTGWQTVTVGPFVAVATTHTLIFTAATKLDGTTDSPDLPADTCNYSSEQDTVDLLLDGVEIIPDTDGDGLFDDEEDARGTDPEVADTDIDLISDGDEVFVHDTDPLDDDSDDDGLIDGVEVLAFLTDPNVPDTDEDGLEDGAEAELGTNPLLEDTDKDGISDGAEVTGGSDPLDPKSPGTGTTGGTPTDTTDTTTTGGGTTDTDTGGSEDDGGCNCDSGGAPTSMAWLFALGGLVRIRRRSA